MMGPTRKQACKAVGPSEIDCGNKWRTDSSVQKHILRVFQLKICSKLDINS